MAMQTWAWPLAFTLFAWWFSTGIILYLDGLPRHTFKWTFCGASVLCALGIGGLVASSGHTSVAAAYCAFTCALLVWAWQEVAFLLGYVTGPSRQPCPADSRGWPRVRSALLAVMHHELALLVLAAAVLAATWGQPNQTGWWTFAVLWAMRQSAKLNVFLGVRNIGENFLPPHLQYMKTYFTRKPMNPLLPVSVLAAGAVVAPIWQAALALHASPFEVASLSLVGSLLSLAILEHVFLVLPLRTEGLWDWGMRSHRAADIGER
jgi:putative photosynthetic complex assembly protein 2